MVGVVVGFVGGKLFSAAVVNLWTTPTAQRLGNLALALGVYWAAVGVGANGIVAAFFGGLAFASATRSQMHRSTEFTEETATILSTLIWMVFGASLVVPLLRAADARAVIFAILALTLVRMVPVAISMIGTGLRPDTVLVMGFLGPRVCHR